MRRVRGFGSAAAATLVVVALLAPAAYAAVSISRAELDGSKLRVEGSGATPNTRVIVNGGAAATSDGAGNFRIESSSFMAPADCKVTVSDGTTSATATLSGCTPTDEPEETLAAPTPLGPANGAGVLVPFTIAWSAVTHSSGIAGYNWQVSATSDFAVRTARDSTLGTVTEDTVSGLPNGTYFWRVQAVSNEPLQQGPWSEVSSFTVTGSTGLAAPTLSLVHGTSFHPWESFGFSWTAVDGASLYVLEYSRDSAFPADATFKIDNIDGLTTGLLIGDHCDGCEQGTYFGRVYAIDANRTAGQLSNTVSWVISYDAPLAPPPPPLAPADGSTLTLPIELRWSDAPNPQAMGYQVEIARDSAFTDVEAVGTQLTNPRYLLLSLTSGTKFWRVRHGQGMASPTVAAFTEWSAPASFTIPDGPLEVQSMWLGAPPCENPCTDTLNSGQEINVSIQLTVAARAGGAVVTLTSSNPSASGTHPETVTVPEGTAFAGYRLFAGSVSEPTQVTLTATVGASSYDMVFTVLPSALKRLSFCCDTTGGFPLPGFLELTGVAPEGGIVVNLASDSPLASPPASVTVPAGSFSVPVPIPTSEVTAATTVTISATFAGQTIQASHTLWPQQPPSALFLDRTSTTGTTGASGTVRIAEAQSHEVQMALSSSRPDLASVPPYALIGVFGVNGGFFVSTKPVTVSTEVTITARGAGVTLTTMLTLLPAGALSGVGVSPATVTGGSSSTGTVTLASAAPAGGTPVALASSNTAAATVPSGVTVPAGQTSAPFGILTSSVGSTTSVTISASAGEVTKTATLTVEPVASDSVSITRAEYDGGKRVLRVEASSSSSPAMLKVYVSATGELIGTLSGGKGEFSWPTNPQSITVKSSLGGSATRTVSAK